jgi:hypothetical protein
MVDPTFRFPYILQGSLQIEREVLRETVITVGTTWTHGVHLASSSAYDLNLNPPTGTTNVPSLRCGRHRPDRLHRSLGRVAKAGFEHSDRGALPSGIRRTPQFSDQPGINNYNALFVQGQRRFQNGLAFQTAYTFSKNIQ